MSFEDADGGCSEERAVVLASGVFDLLHLGHVRFLEEAKKSGGPRAQLIVIVARDSTVQKRKGVKPIMSEAQRRALVASLRVVNASLLGFEKFNIGKVLEKIKPSVVAFGYDQTEIEKTVKDYVKRHGLNVEVIRIGKFGEDELDSSSKIKQKITEDLSS
jgi:FAD synthetase